AELANPNLIRAFNSNRRRSVDGKLQQNAQAGSAGAGEELALAVVLREKNRLSTRISDLCERLDPGFDRVVRDSKICGISYLHALVAACEIKCLTDQAICETRSIYDRPVVTIGCIPRAIFAFPGTDDS